MAIGLIGSASLQAAQDLSTMFSEGKASGQIRAFSIARTIDGSSDYTRSANAIGGHLKFETADYKGLSFGTAFYTTNGIAIKSDRANNKKVDPTLLGQDKDSYSILGEAYLQFKYENTIFKGGRQKLDTPMAGSDDARMLPNLFEAYLLINKDIPNTTLVAGHVSKFAAGSFANAYNGGELGVTSGYTAVAGNSAKYQGEFTNMGTWAVGESTDGVSLISATYAKDSIKAQIWDYYAHDILNAIYADISISWDCIITDSIKPFAAAQIIKEDSVGDEFAGDVDSLYWGAKVGANIGDFSAYLAYSQQSDADAGKPLKDATITPWGGMPAYTQGMVTRHQFLAGTNATKLAASYNFKDIGLKTIAYYATFDMDSNNGYTHGDADEYGFDFIYNTPFVKNLQLRVRANYANDFNVNAAGNTTSWDEYRFIANYAF